jgi:transcriptional regulator with XRE-family HTH domain
MTLKTKDSLAETWWARMRQKRTALGLTLQEAAGLAQVDLSMLSRWERGERPKPAVPAQVRIARALACRVDELFGPAGLET